MEGLGDMVRHPLAVISLRMFNGLETLSCDETSRLDRAVNASSIEISSD